MSGPWPFVGRRAELDRAIKAARAGLGVLVLGEGGVGKTAFVQTLAGRLAGHGTTPTHVAGHELTANTPFAVLAGAFGEPGGRKEPETTAQVVRRVLRELGAHALDRPILIVDDLPLVDEHSAGVIFELARAHRVVVLATAQEQPLPEGGRRLWQEGFVERIELAGFTTDEVAEYLEGGLGGPVDVATVRAFAQRSQGNPLMLHELVAAALESGALVHRSAWTLGGAAPVGSGARDLVGRRLAGVQGAHRRALELVAATEPIALSILVHSVDPIVLDALETEHLITVRPGMTGPEVTSAHPLHGEILRTTMPAVRLRRYRMDLAQQIEAAPGARASDLVRAALWRLEDGQPQDVHRLLTAARAARAISLATAERLARQAVESGGGVEATVLLAEVLTHSGRRDEAAKLTGQLPPESLTPADREALVYCAAMGEGLTAGDAARGVDVVERALAGDRSASSQLRALHVSLLALDARHAEALDRGRDLVDDEQAEPPVRALAAVGVVGAEYWQGRLRRAISDADRLAPVLRAARDTVPYGECSVELIAACAELDLAQLDDAIRRGESMRRQAMADNDPFALPRSEYVMGRVDQFCGRGRTAVHRFRRCVASLTLFDQFTQRYLWGVLARAAAEAGDLDGAERALEQGTKGTVLRAYQPEWEQARAAVLAGRLNLAAAADRATWAASLAIEHGQWTSAVFAYHDAARYGAARAVLPAMLRVQAVDGPFATCLVTHVEALASGDADTLDAVALRCQALGALALAREMAAEAAFRHAREGDQRAARASGVRVASLNERVETPLAPWLVGAVTVGPQLTPRERQVALLALRGRSDKEIAGELGISARTVSTHLSRCYSKLGVQGRGQLGNSPVLGKVGS